MPIEVRIPRVGESITEVRLGDWRKSEGDSVAADEVLLEVESEKATFDLPAPAAGVLTKILRKPGDTVAVDEVIATIDDAASPTKGKPGKAAKPQSVVSATKADEGVPATPAGEPRVMPAAARALAERGLQPSQVTPMGPGGRLLKEDVERAARPASPAPPALPPAVRAAPPRAAAGSREDEIVPMTLLRRRIAERLVQASQNAALLTTFNEVDMSAVNELRTRHKDAFAEKHGVKLGFMSFFVKASVDALQAFPLVNAEIRGTDIVYHRYCDVGVAIGGGKGLVVPVLRNAETMTFAQVEQAIADFAQRAKSNALTPDELQGGTFTISNGGVYGSMLSTPIVNPPQSGVLGMHAIQDRPVARNGQVVIRPMMYLALTYDHRIVDGREAVSFLKRIKDGLEEPARLLLEV